MIVDVSTVPALTLAEVQSLQQQTVDRLKNVSVPTSFEALYLANIQLALRDLNTCIVNSAAPPATAGQTPLLNITTM